MSEIDFQYVTIGKVCFTVFRTEIANLAHATKPSDDSKPASKVFNGVLCIDVLTTLVPGIHSIATLKSAELNFYST